MLATTLGQAQKEALRQVKELLTDVGTFGERHADGFVAPIVSCLYDDEGLLECAVDCSSLVQQPVEQGERLCSGRCGFDTPRRQNGRIMSSMASAVRQGLFPSRRRMECS